MKKIVDKLKHYMKSNKKLFLFLTIIFTIGVIAGTIFSLTLNKNDSILVTEYLGEYIRNIKSNNINYITSLINSLSSNIIISLIIWLLGFSVIGIPIILILFFYKSFVIGFSIGSIFINYKFKGILLSTIYIFPHHIINILVMVFLIIYSFITSSKIVDAVVKRKEIDFKPITHAYFILLLLTVGINIFTSLYESFVVPFIMKLLGGML